MAARREQEMGAYRHTPRRNARRRLSDGAEDCYEALPLSRTAYNKYETVVVYVLQQSMVVIIVI